MEHLHFTTNQTAAAYVADRLDRETQEAFELHMMECGECLREVESWRAIKHTLSKYSVAPQEGSVEPAMQTESATLSGTTASPIRIPSPSQADAGAVVRIASARAANDVPQRAPRYWGLAAGLAAALTVGAIGGWSAHSVQSSALDSDATAFFSLPALARGPSDCVAVTLEHATRLVALRVPGAAADQQLVAVDGDGHDLATDGYRVRTQADGSWLVRLRATTLREQGIRFEARSADGTAEPRGCVQSTLRE